MTVAQLLEYIRLEIKEPDTNHYSDANLLTLLNRGRIETVKALEECIETSSDIAVLAGTALVSLPSNTLKIKRVWNGTTEIPPIDEATLTAQVAGWTTAVGTPTRFFQVGLTQIRLYPIPDAPLTAKLEYYQEPPELTIGGSSTLPSWLDYLSCDWTRWKILHMDQDVRASDALQIYTQGLRESLAFVRRSKPRPQMVVSYTR